MMTGCKNITNSAKAAASLAVPAAAALLLAFNTAIAQEYPSKPVRFVTPGIGNSFDIASRTIATAITPSLGQQVIVDNRPPGVIPGQVALQAPPDGYTLLYSGSSLWLGPYLQASTPYDPMRDFAPITMVTLSPTLLVVHPSLPVKSARDLIVLAKSKPGVLNYASGATGSVNHLTAELFKSMAHVDMVRIAYKGSGPALIDLIAGQVQVMFSVAGSVAPHARSGKLRVVAITSAKQSELAPGVPTVSESGLPGFEAVSIAGLFAPAKVPKPIIERINHEVVKALARPEIRKKFLETDVEPIGSTPDEFGTAVRADAARMGKLIKDLGIHEN
jgi:tripartite-type tricarboxylate transporter receptor subunit TctC